MLKAKKNTIKLVAVVIALVMVFFAASCVSRISFDNDAAALSAKNTWTTASVIQISNLHRLAKVWGYVMFIHAVVTLTLCLTLTGFRC